jgi:very-short-patch-repair endonuclease
MSIKKELSPLQQLNKAKRETLEDEFSRKLRILRILEPIRQYRFSDKRRFLLDFAYPQLKLGIEIQGGTWMSNRSGHTSGAGVKRDCEKSNLAVTEGWDILYFTSDMVRDFSFEPVLRDVLKLKENEFNRTK